MEIQLRPELERFIKTKIELGDFPNENEAVNAAVAVFKAEQEEGLGDWTEEELKAELAPALAELDRGGGTPWNVEEVKALRDRLLAERQKPSAETR